MFRFSTLNVKEKVLSVRQELGSPVAALLAGCVERRQRIRGVRSGTNSMNRAPKWGEDHNTVLVPSSSRSNRRVLRKRLSFGELRRSANVDFSERSGSIETNGAAASCRLKSRSNEILIEDHDYHTANDCRDTTRGYTSGGIISQAPQAISAAPVRRPMP